MAADYYKQLQGNKIAELAKAMKPHSTVAEPYADLGEQLKQSVELAKAWQKGGAYSSAGTLGPLDAYSTAGTLGPLDIFKKMDAEQEAQIPFMKVNVGPTPINLSAFQSSPYHRILLIGDSGTGKTHFLGTMPKPFIADFDRGLSTLSGKDVQALMYSPTNGWPEFRKEVQEWRQGAKYGCETFCLDSMTTAADAALTWVLVKNGRSGQQPTVQDWGEAIREVKALMGYLTTLPCHVAVTAHAQVVKDELLGDVQYLPLLYGKDLPHRLGIWFDEVYMTTVTSEVKNGAKANRYRLQVKPDTRMKILKSRMNTDGALLDTYEEPDFGSLVAKIEKAKPAPTN